MLVDCYVDLSCLRIAAPPQSPHCCTIAVAALLQSHRHRLTIADAKLS